jgi:hypothetical protein
MLCARTVDIDAKAIVPPVFSDKLIVIWTAIVDNLGNGICMSISVASWSISYILNASNSSPERSPDFICSDLSIMLCPHGPTHGNGC